MTYKNLNKIKDLQDAKSVDIYGTMLYTVFSQMQEYH